MVIDGEAMGSIHYGLSTAAMKKALAEARECGVEAICYDCSVGVEEIAVATSLPLKLEERHVRE